MQALPCLGPAFGLADAHLVVAAFEGGRVNRCRAVDVQLVRDVLRGLLTMLILGGLRRWLLRLRTVRVERSFAVHLLGLRVVGWMGQRCHWKTDGGLP